PWVCGEKNRKNKPQNPGRRLSDTRPLTGSPPPPPRPPPGRPPPARRRILRHAHACRPPLGPRLDRFPRRFHVRPRRRPRPATFRAKDSPRPGEVLLRVSLGRREEGPRRAAPRYAGRPADRRRLRPGGGARQAGREPDPPGAA